MSEPGKMSLVKKDEIYKWLDTNNFCVMPFGHIAIESNGDIRPCCLGNTLKKDDGTSLNIGNGSIADIIKHPAHIKFREAFTKNEQHPACHPCWGVNSKDRFSGRYVYSSSVKVQSFVEEIMSGKMPEQKLVWLEIKAGNRCNLACRICGLWNSAKWLKETFDLKKLNDPSYPDFKSSFEFNYNQQAKWIDNIDFWQNIDMFEDIKVIHIMGGEPLMIEEHYEMLKAIINRFDASKIWLWYNTNGTVIPTAEQEAILDKFQAIHWSLSIDDFGDKFDYQRKGAVWDEAKNNLEYFFSKPNYHSTIDATISIFNIATLGEFIMELEKMPYITSFSPHYVTTIDSPNNVRTLHTNIKAELTVYLEQIKSQINTKHHRVVSEIIDFMNGIDMWSEDIDIRRKKEIFYVDKSRDEDFIKTFPEMARLLNYE
jgi:MoaA/NifB/PqqE/SkfB family radical SAM enzyme